MQYHWYITPQKLSQMNKNMSNEYWNFQLQVSSFYHAWWTCALVKKFWTKIHQKLNKIIRVPIPKTPEIFLLGLKLEEFTSIDKLLYDTGQQ